MRPIPPAQGWFQRHWPVVVSLGLFWGLLGGMLAIALRLNQGQLSYVLDDAYIHLAMAKNFTTGGTWGVTADAFTSTTSSPLWTLLLGGLCRFFGVSDSYPLWLNLACATGILAVSYIILKREVKSQPLQLTILVLLTLVTPLATLALTGMEHSLHLLLSLAFTWLAADDLAEVHNKDVHLRLGRWLLMGVLAFLLVAVRYEGMFKVLVVCVLLVLRKRFTEAASLGAAGLLPVAIYGLVSLGQGWYFLPNSVLLKGRLPVFSAEGLVRLLGYTGLEQLKNNGVLLFLCLGMIASIIYYLKREQSTTAFRLNFMIIVLCSLLLHLQFAQTGWFYRYEAYLVFMGGLAVGLNADDWLREYRRIQAPLRTSFGILSLVLLSFIVLFPFGDRSLRALLTTSQAMNNIYEQQQQMARFVLKYYNGQAVAINDIGAVAYRTDARLLDLWGLASQDVARLKLRGEYGPGAIADLAERSGVEIAIVYDLFFEETGGLPERWEKVGEWQIANNRVCASDTVAFYAIREGARSRLWRNLKDFQMELPQDVAQRGAYLESEGDS
jgi:hypothetical protein